MAKTISEKTNKIVNVIISLGAAVVIIGALAKIIHLSWADWALIVGLTLEAARRYAADGRLIVIFQPHRYSRTKAFAAEFATVLDAADRAIVLEVYAASEKPIEGVTSKLITSKMKKGEYIPNFVEVTDSVIEMAQPGDVIMTLGAGDVSSLAPIIVDGLNRRFA